MGAEVDRVANGKTTVTRYDFKPVSASTVAAAKPASVSALGAPSDLLTSLMKKTPDAPPPGPVRQKGF